MRRRQDRVLGPTWVPSKGRWRVLVITEGESGEKGGRAARWFGDEESASAAKAKIEDGLVRLSATTIGEAIDLYQGHLTEKGTLPVSYREVVRRLRLFFPDLEMPINRLKPEHAKAYYETFRKRKRIVHRHNNDDRPISVAYHRAALANAKSFFKWCVREHGWLKANPLADVEPIGEANAGKKQLTGNELRRVFSYCYARAQKGDEAALGVLMEFLMALRSSDVTRRIVRDIDLDCTVLRVFDGKTEESNRPRHIPEVLQPILRELATGRAAHEPLFRAESKNGHHGRTWLYQALRRYCDALGIDRVCQHSLKGSSGSVLAAAGESSETIARHLSHGDRGETARRHYVDAGALAQGTTERALVVISGGRK